MNTRGSRRNLLVKTRDKVAVIPTGLIHQRELAAQIERAKASLGPEVTHVAYRIREDSTGEPSIFFRITLLDWAIAENLITDVTGRIATVLFDEVRPVENWGLRPYFNVRSHTIGTDTSPRGVGSVLRGIPFADF